MYSQRTPGKLVRKTLYLRKKQLSHFLFTLILFIWLTDGDRLWGDENKYPNEEFGSTFEKKSRGEKIW